MCHALIAPGWVHENLEFRRSRSNTWELRRRPIIGMTLPRSSNIWRNGVIVTPSIHVASRTFSSNGSYVLRLTNF